MQQAGGLLALTVVAARLTRDTDTFGKMDPYVVIEYRGTKYKTRTHQSGGKNPFWNQEFQLSVGAIGDDLTIKVMDEDVSSDDFIGMTIMKVSSLVINNGVNEWFNITYKEK